MGRSRSERDLREVISREVRGTGDLRDRLEEVRGAIREEEQRAAGRDPSETCEMPICNTESKLTVYSDEKSPDSKGKENSKEENAKEKVEEGKEKTLTSEWGQRKRRRRKGRRVDQRRGSLWLIRILRIERGSTVLNPRPKMESNQRKRNAKDQHQEMTSKKKKKKKS